MTVMHVPVRASTPDDVRLTARQWADDRIIPPEIGDAFAWLAAEAAVFAAMHAPDDLVVDLRWADPDHAEIEVKWPTGAWSDRKSTEPRVPAMTAAFLSQLTSEWKVFHAGDAKGLRLLVDVTPTDAAVG